MEDILILSEDGKTLLGVKDKSVREVVIPDGVEVIEDYVFGGCTYLQVIYIPQSVKFIDKQAFIGCLFLREINVDKNNKFYHSLNGELYDKGLKKIIQASLDHQCYKSVFWCEIIGERAFCGAAIEHISIPDDVTTIEARAFEACTSLQDIHVSDNLKTIGDYAFNGCCSLTSFRIPNSLVSLGRGVFSDCI